MRRRGGWWLACLLAATLAACGGAHHAAHPGPAGEARPASVGDGSAWRINHLPALGVTFGNDLIAITFDGQSGRITQIEDRRRDPRLRLLDPSLDLTGVPPLALEEIKKIPLFNKYKIQPVDLPDRQPTFSRASDRLTLRWDYPAPLPAVEAEWRLTADAPELRVFVRVILRDQRQIVQGLALYDGRSVGFEDAFQNLFGGIIADVRRQFDGAIVARDRRHFGREIVCELLGNVGPDAYFVERTDHRLPLEE